MGALVLSFGLVAWQDRASEVASSEPQSTSGGLESEVTYVGEGYITTEELSSLRFRLTKIVHRLTEACVGSRVEPKVFRALQDLEDNLPTHEAPQSSTGLFHRN